ncbi:response regulator [Sphingomonas sp. BK235]|jgi:DNA-binding response OmpR family regulator|uniref:response regulator n=1 Tax=Sphingomonas sp. BK235 TaxID=2512131 RepID=UPI0010459E0E|nr:response regulator [Sphingomonas sp. BK235]TCP32692.1 response regulator receiver domain-containing protein [Sphingomonas sp. BK235]
MVFGRKRRILERLLLVEDEPLVAFDAEHLLTDQGYTIVATVDRVADAVAVLEGAGAVDLVLLDVRLADGSGTEVARAARTRGVAVLFVTGACPDEAATLASGFLAKPYAHADLLAAIAAIEQSVAGKRPRRLPGGFQLFAPAGPAAV